MTRTIVDPPVSRYSDRAEIDAWISELDRRLAAPLDESARLAFLDARQEATEWLESRPDPVE